MGKTVRSTNRRTRIEIKIFSGERKKKRFFPENTNTLVLFGQMGVKIWKRRSWRRKGKVAGKVKAGG